MTLPDPIVVAGLVAEPIDTTDLVAQVARDDCGAVVTFEGRVRSPNAGKQVIALEYEAYEERATAQLQTLAQRAVSDFDLGAAAAVHRTGRLEPGAIAVVIITVAPHRQRAFAATSWLLDAVKQEVAIWKKEETEDGSHWVGV